MMTTTKHKPETFHTAGIAVSAASTSAGIPGILPRSSSTRSERNERVMERTRFCSCPLGARSTIQLMRTMDPSKMLKGLLKKPPGSQCKPSATTRTSSSSV